MKFKNWNLLFSFIEEKDEDDEQYNELENIDCIPLTEASSFSYDKFMEQVDDFRLTKKKFRMPKLDGNGLVGNVIILNTVNDSSIRRFITNPLIDDRGIYKCVYRNRNINMTVKGKTLHVRETKERTEYYAKCRSSFGLNGYISFSGYSGKNVYYDIYRENELFFSNIPESTSKNIRAEEYFRMLKENVFCVDMNEYTNKLMFIDLKEWEAKVQSSSNKDYDNPINLIYYGLKKNLELVKETLKDVNVVIFTQDAFIKFNPKDCDENSYKHFLKEVKKLSNTIVKEEEIEDKTIDKVDDTLNNGEDSDSENVTNDKSISDVISVAAKDISVNEPDKSSDEKVKAALQNPEVISKLAEKIYEPVNIKNTAISRRDRELREQQKKLKVDGANLEDLITVKASQIKVPVNDVSNVVNTENHEITQVQFDNFAKVYNDKLYMKDLVSIAYDLQDKSIPVYIRKVEKEDTSDALNAKYTLTFHLEDSNRGRHTLKFDVPKFIDGRYMYLNGHKKIFNNQRFLKPLVKTGPDTVQVCTNYNKIFMYRHGDKVEALYEKFKELVITDKKNFSYKRGDCSRLNSEYKTTIEYDTLAKYFAEITVKGLNPPLTLVFSQPKMKELAESFGLGAEFATANKDGETKLVAGYYDFGTQSKGKRYKLLIMDTEVDMQGDTNVCKEEFGLDYVDPSVIEGWKPVYE